VTYAKRSQRMVHILGKLSRRCGLLIGAAALCVALASSLPRAQVLPADEPLYAANGDLLLPKGFDTWVFVGSNLGLSYTPEAAAAASAPPPRAARQQFHNVSINKAAYDHFLANGRFPEKTVLVMQVFEAADKEPRGVLASGLFNGRRVGLEVAVKNASRPDGKTTPWAYYNFTDPSERSKVVASAPAFPDEACANCHQHHASIDNVWVQFYPALRDRRQ
jgi:Cytochrome P460